MSAVTGAIGWGLWLITVVLEVALAIVFFPVGRRALLSLGRCNVKRPFKPREKCERDDEKELT